MCGPEHALSRVGALNQKGNIMAIVRAKRPKRKSPTIPTRIVTPKKPKTELQRALERITNLEKRIKELEIEIRKRDLDEITPLSNEHINAPNEHPK